MHITRLAGPLLVIGLTVAACSGSAATTGPTAAPASAAPASVAPASMALVSAAAPSSAATTGGNAGGYSRGGPSAPAGGAAAVTLAKTALGTILVNGAGMTLYMLMADTATSSACTSGCATNWPPLAGSAPTLGAGLIATDFGSLARPDGTKQVTFHGHPLYTYAGDQSAGQTSGEGVGGKWYVLGSNGNPIK